MKKIIFLIIILLMSSTLKASEPSRFIKKIKLTTGQSVVVAEGDFEARSIGSFSVRVYDAAPIGDETTFFISGLIHTRDGTIEKVILVDINDDQKQEIIVIARSVGTGGYLSAYAFAFDNKQLRYLSGIDGLLPDADPLKAFRTSIWKEK